MNVRIDLSSPAPAYRQIADAIRVGLVDGSLAAGDSLPPVRRLALDLGVHFNTVAEAYRILAAEGWLELKRRRGALVLPRARQARTDRREWEDRFRRNLRELVAKVRASGVGSARIATVLRETAQEIEP